MESQVIKLTIPGELVDLLEARRPKTLPTATFCAFLIEQGLDRPVTLGVASGSEATTSSSNSSSSSIKEKNKTIREGRKSKDLPTDYPPDFEAFWKAYQRLPEKASKQSKPLALNAWKAATKVNTPEELLQAVANTLATQQREMASERGFTVCLPDCFRWLRDGCHLAQLESHTPAQRSAVW